MLKQIVLGALVGALLALAVIGFVLNWSPVQSTVIDNYYETCRQKGWPKC